MRGSALGAVLCFLPNDASAPVTFGRCHGKRVDRVCFGLGECMARQSMLGVLGSNLLSQFLMVCPVFVVL